MVLHGSRQANSFSRETKEIPGFTGLEEALLSRFKTDKSVEIHKDSSGGDTAQWGWKMEGSFLVWYSPEKCRHTACWSQSAGAGWHPAGGKGPVVRKGEKLGLRTWETVWKELSGSSGSMSVVQDPVSMSVVQGE